MNDDTAGIAREIAEMWREQAERDIFARLDIHAPSVRGSCTTARFINADDFAGALAAMDWKPRSPNPFIQAAINAGLKPGDKCNIVIPESFRQDARLAVWMTPEALQPFMCVSRHVKEMLIFTAGNGVFSH